MDDKERLRYQQAVKRANDARQVMENPMVKEALEVLEKQIMQEWKATHPKDEKGREKLFFMSGYLDDFKQHFLRAMRDGDQAGKILKNPNLLQRIF